MVFGSILQRFVPRKKCSSQGAHEACRVRPVHATDQAKFKGPQQCIVCEDIPKDNQLAVDLPWPKRTFHSSKGIAGKGVDNACCHISPVRAIIQELAHLVARKLRTPVAKIHRMAGKERSCDKLIP